MTARVRTGASVLGAALLLALSACEVTRKPALEEETTDIGATAREAVYPMEHLGAGKITLANGAYVDSSGTLEVKLVKSATGDIDGDGRPDAAVVLASQTGGSGTFVDLFAVLQRGHGYMTRGPASLGDRVKVDSLRVSDKAVLVHLVTHGPDDPLCCPTQLATETFVLHADTLMRKPAEQP